MPRLERKSLTRWENGVVKTYYRGDDVPDLNPSGLSGVMLTQEEGGGVRRKVSGKTAQPKTETFTVTDSDSDSDDVDIIERLEGNAESVKAYVLTVDRIDLLEEILVAEGEGKNRSTVRGAIEDRIKALEEEQES